MILCVARRIGRRTANDDRKPTVKKLAALLVALTVGAPTVANASLVTFSYSATFGAVNISASGQMQIADTANLNGSFDVLGISGTRRVNADVQTITGLGTAGNFSFDNDLYLNPSLNNGHYFTDFGLLYKTSAANGTQLVNVFDNFSGTYGQPAGYGESSSPANPAFNPVAHISKLDIQRVPEPATSLLVGLALLGVAFATRTQARRHADA